MELEEFVHGKDLTFSLPPIQCIGNARNSHQSVLLRRVIDVFPAGGSVSSGQVWLR